MKSIADINDAAALPVVSIETKTLAVCNDRH